MCGIAGFYSPQKIFSENDLEKMTFALTHRGPDAAGYFSDEVVGLGNRRLKVIDLSESANQPMYSLDGRYVMVYNGEVYNYNEIANEIKADSGERVSFQTSSDTEVILAAFVQYGLSFVDKLNGMFAIAIYDKQKKELLLYRDRLGIKPLYYYWDGSNLAFASELKALTPLNQLSLKINHSAIHDFLHVGYIPAPASIYQSVFKLEAGSYLKVSESKLEIHRYWNAKSQLAEEVMQDEKVAIEKLNDLIISSVKYQMKSDVPFGIFLSGGIDSSLITAMAVRHSTVNVNTFSIGFEENLFNEAAHAKKVAQHLGTVHHEFIVSYKDALPLVDKMIDVYDEPYADSSAIPAMLVSKMAKQHVTVALSGEGGDELFFGYGVYQWARRLANPLVKLMHQPVASVLENYPDERYNRAALMLKYSSYKNIRSHIFSQEQRLFSEGELKDMLLGNAELNHSDINYSERKIGKRMLSAMEEQAMFDLEYYLPDDLLTKVDRASMQYSLEARVPYLDHRIVEFALNLSPKLKVHNGVAKYILKQILYQYVPKSYFERRKQGFSIPLSFWLQNELKYLIDDYLNEEIIERCGIVHYKKVEQLKRDFFAGREYLYNRIWALIVLHKWLSQPRG
jgi:asparagine synthase (glutamine-hydrolysing)